MSSAFLNNRYEILDLLSESLYSTVISLPHGGLIERVSGILQWRSALLDGELPNHEQLNWPDQQIKITLLKRLESLNIARYCRQQEELTDLILIDICEGISTAEEYFKIKPDGFVDKLAQQQNKRERESEFKDEAGISNDGSQQKTSETTETTETSAAPVEAQIAPPLLEPSYSDKFVGIDDEDEAHQQLPLNELNDVIKVKKNEVSTPLERQRSADEQISNKETIAHLSKWQERVESWDELSESFNELSGFLGQGWDLTQGVLASQGWRDIIRYRQLTKQLPEIKRLMNMLGRLQSVTDTESGCSLSGKLVDPIRRNPEKEEKLIPHIIMETGGLERGNELNRMLPSELAQLGSSTLKTLWFSRYAERMLLTYQYQGYSPEVEAPEQQESIDSLGLREKETKGMGPVIICLDTSGSMHGEPEQVAKAVTLEALRIAFAEGRACHLYMFGGPDEIIEHKLDLTRGGLAQLLAFLQYSFHGGTDVAQPLLKALEKQRNNDWKKADILLMSDGRFSLQDSNITQILELKRKQKIRIHGLILGHWKNQCMEQLCEPLHRFNDWAVLAD